MLAGRSLKRGEEVLEMDGVHGSEKLVVLEEVLDLIH